MNRTLLTYLLFVFHSYCYGQNLVPNPSFEKYNLCPFWLPTSSGSYPTHIAYSPGYDSFPTVNDWISPIENSTPDYFNDCENSPNGHGVPVNTFGTQVPRNGHAYAGGYMVLKNNSSQDDYREYIESELITPLVAGHDYKVSLFVSVAVSHVFPFNSKILSVNNVGAFFSNTIVSQSAVPGKVYLNNPLTNIVIKDCTISDTSSWVELSGTYHAQGNEQWITIGHFRDSVSERDSFMYCVVNPGSTDTSSYSYFYIDDVCVMDLTDSTNDTTICANSFPVAIKPIEYEGAEFSWNTGEKTTSITVTKPGIYWRKASGECLYRIDTFKVLTRPYPVLGSDRDVCPYPAMVLNADMPGTEYRWNTGDTECCIPITKTGTYALTAKNACGTESASVHLNLLSACDTCLWVPTAFTPNNDGSNDIFRARSRCQLNSFSMKIYNRIGQSVFDTNDILRGWDGTFNGVPQDVGVFYYHIRYQKMTTGGRTDEILKGDITLVR